jgi:3-deoxy-D-manno-octulosonic-acid transferase
MRRGWGLRLYLLVSHGLALIAPAILRRRLRAGKEHPTRWREKLGQGLAARPDGRLIWLHAVGLGEVMSLRGLIGVMAAQRPEVQFLVTSTTAASAEVFARNLPPRTLHQFLPVDAPACRARFLDHFRPDLCLWVEQDLWPGLVSDLADRGIPQAVVAGRMNAASFARHSKGRGIYRDLYRVMARVTAQDPETAHYLQQLGATAEVTGSLKPAGPTLACDPKALAEARKALAGRRVWAVAPSHPADETTAFAAHDILLRVDPTALLIVAPRFPARRDEIAFRGVQPLLKSNGQVPGPDDAVWLFDTFGDLGLVYGLADAVLVGGTFDETEGHNPWEAAALDTAVMHGPQTANFAADFRTLAQAEASIAVQNGESVAQALQRQDLSEIAARAHSEIAAARLQMAQLATELLALVEKADD